MRNYERGGGRIFKIGHETKKLRPFEIIRLGAIALWGWGESSGWMGRGFHVVIRTYRILRPIGERIFKIGAEPKDFVRLMH